MVLKTQSEPSRSLFRFLPFPSYNNEIEGFSMIPQNPLSTLLLVTLFLASALPFSSSLSSIAIGEASNQTLICAMTTQTSVNCTIFPWGIQIPIPSYNISLSAITAGDSFVCILTYPTTTSLNCVGCWNFTGNGTDLTYKRIYRGSVLDDLDAGTSHICGIISDSDSLVCWQWPGFNSSNLQNLSDVVVGQDFGCSLLETGQITCYGYNNNNNIVGSEPAGSYSSIAAGLQQACAISTDGTSVNCWGQTPVSLSGSFNSLASGDNRGCAIQENGTVLCWGENDFALPESLEGVYFLAITGKNNVFCGVLTQNYSLICWGDENSDSSSVVFQSVMPGPCQTRSQCECGALPDYGQFCNQGVICQACPLSTIVYEPASAPALTGGSPALTGGSPSTTNNGKAITELVVGWVGFAALISVFFFLLYKLYKRKVSQVHDSRLSVTIPESALHQDTDSSSVKGSSFAPSNLEQRLSHLASMGSTKFEVFHLEELRQATDNFSDDHKIGSGSYGSVYRATLQDGREVAIKRAESTVSTSPLYVGGAKHKEDKDCAFLSELSHLSRLNHKNLVQLYGYCDEANERLLIYEFMVNGTLHDHLHRCNEQSALKSWAARIKVALDAARGIEYLHTYAVPKIIHRDIKSSNILIDGEWIAKVSDFGLSLMGPPDNPDDDEAHISLRAAGTVGYMDPAYYKFQQLTSKSDVYSFGVVLLEILSGHKAIHRNEENGLPRNVVHHMVPYIIKDEIHKVLDPKVPPPTPCEIEAVAYVGYLAADCVVCDGRDRPTMTEIVDSLERALAACLSDPCLSRSTTGSTIHEIV